MTTQDTLNRLANGDWVHAGAKDSPEISHILQACSEKCFELNSLPPSKAEQRNALIKSLLGSIGDGFMIHSPFRCDFGSNIHIGNNFASNYNLSILDEAQVTIGDNVMIGPNCSIITIIHAFEATQRNAGLMKAKAITIGNNVWIAANVVILPGVEIGDGAIIGAGSVVTKSIAANTLAAGNPCRPIRSISDYDRI